MTISREHLAPNRVWAIPVRDNGKRTTFYTEQLPFVPGSGVEQLGDPVEYAPAAPQHDSDHIPDATKMVDAEPVELLGAMRNFTLEHDSGIAGILRGAIDAKLSALNVKP